MNFDKYSPVVICFNYFFTLSQSGQRYSTCTMREQRCCASRNASLAAVRSIASIAVATHSPYRSRDSGTRRVRCVNSGVVPGGTRRRNADCTVDRCSRRCDCLSSPAPRALPLSPAADRQTDRQTCTLQYSAAVVMRTLPSLKLRA